MTAQKDTLLTAEDVVETLAEFGVIKTRRAVSKMFQKKQLPSRLILGRRRIRKSQLHTYLAKRGFPIERTAT